MTISARSVSQSANSDDSKKSPNISTLATIILISNCFDRMFCSIQLASSSAACRGEDTLKCSGRELFVRRY